MNLKLYTINTSYVEYLRSYQELFNVFENKDGDKFFTRKYIGIVMKIGKYNYYAPLSSPKNTDYIIKGNAKIIRRSIIPIIRIVVADKNGSMELKGAIKLNNMIPVPKTMVTYYDVSKEENLDYKVLIEKEYEFIRKNKKLILKNAKVLYNQNLMRSNCTLQNQKSQTI